MCIAWMPSSRSARASGPWLKPKRRCLVHSGFNPVGGIDAVANVVDSLEWKMWSLLQKEKSLESTSN